jgi:hypothetical protein
MELLLRKTGKEISIYSIWTDFNSTAKSAAMKKIIYGFLLLPIIITAQTKVNTINRTKLPLLTKAQIDQWNHIQFDQLGVMGSDYDGRDEIGTCPTERMDNVFSSSRLDFWFPNVRNSEAKRAYKQTMIGKLRGSEHYSNEIIFPDFDNDFYVVPEPKYNFLIDESPKPNVNYKTAFGQLVHFDWPDCPDYFKEVEAEIDLKDIHEKQFAEFFNDEMNVTGYAGFYGPWIYDRGHCDHPEIHPTEQIWWSYKKGNTFSYHCNLICDYSKRYMNASELDDNGGKYTKIKPWAEPPIDGVFAIAFAIDPRAEKNIFRIFLKGSNNVNANNTQKFDAFKVHHLLVNGQRIASVLEPESETMSVNFENLGYDANGNILGYLVIRSSVGHKIDNSHKDPGHLFFEVKKEIVKNNATPVVPGRLKITLESIECTAVDDYGDDEEVYGLILAKAYTTSDTTELYPNKLSHEPSIKDPYSGCNFSTDVIWCLQCPKTIKFVKGQKTALDSYSLTYNFPAAGYIEITGDLNENDSDNCSDFDQLGVPQKKIILTSELDKPVYRFSQHFASGGTRLKANFRIEKL